MKRKLAQFVKTICARDNVKMVLNQPNQHKFSVSKKLTENLNGTESLEAAKLLALTMRNQLMVNPKMVITVTNQMVIGVTSLMVTTVTGVTNPMVTTVTGVTNPMVTMVTSPMAIMVTNQTMKNQNQLILLPSLIIQDVKKLN